MLWDTFGQLVKEHLTAWTMILLLIGMVIVLFTTLIAKDMRWAVALFLLAVVFTGSANPAIHMVFYILRWVFLALITSRLIFRHEKLPRMSLVHWLVLLWVAISILSAFQAPSIFRGVAFGVIYFLSFIVFFLLAPISMGGEQQIKLWLRMFTYFAITILLLSVGLYISDPSGFSREGGRLTLLFANPGHLSDMLLFSSILFLWFGLKSEGHIFWQLICFLLTLFSAFLMLLTGTRGALAAFAIAIIVFCFHYRTKMIFLILPVLIAGSVYIAPRVLATRSRTFQLHFLSLRTTHRPALRKLAIERIWEKPVLGWGLASVSDMRSPVCPNFVSFHNSFLDYAVEIGVPGFLVVAALLGYTYIRAGMLAAFVARDKYIKDMAWFVVANLTAMYALALFSRIISTPNFFHFYWLWFLVVLTECLYHINSRQSEVIDYVDVSAEEGLDYYEHQEVYEY